MADESQEKLGLIERLKHTYRLVIMNNETFEEVGSYKLSLLNVYILSSSVAIVVALLVISLIIFTPLKRYIPGYGDVKEHAELLRLNQELQIIEEELAAQRAYTENFRKILVGEVETEVDQASEEVDLPDSLLIVDRIQEDEILRQEAALNERLQQRELMSKTANFSPRQIPLEQIYFIPPLTGVIGKEFNAADRHFGIDIIAPKNVPIKATMDGYVITADWTLETGQTIGIQHANNIVSFYKHNSALLKKVGDYVKSGEAIAIIGNSGTLSSGPHLHFELWTNGIPIDPARYVNFE